MNVLVTGGGGFLGQALCRGLVAQGHAVTSYNRGDYPALTEMGVRQLRGDLADRGAVVAACAGMARSGTTPPRPVLGRYDEYHRANVMGTGTCSMAAAGMACRPGLHVDAKRDPPCHHPSPGHRGDSSYGRRFKAPYAATKLVAEKIVLAANDDTLAPWHYAAPDLGPGPTSCAPPGGTCACRPAALIGSGTTHRHHLRRHAAQGTSTQCHLDIGAACGRAYYQQRRTQAVREIVNALLQAAGAPAVRRTLRSRCIRRRCRMRGAVALLSSAARLPLTPSWPSNSAHALDTWRRPPVISATCAGHHRRGLQRLRQSLRG